MNELELAKLLFPEVTETPEDIEAKRIIEANKPKEEEESPLSLYPSDSIVYGSGYVNPSLDQDADTEIEEEKEENDNA